MAFQVVFYTFTKHANSTARPSGTGHPYNCMGKDPLSVTKPRLQLRLADGAQDNPSAWNYAYISAFGRYYWVTEWTNEGPLWTASLSVDSLASWKTDIGAATVYVYRSSAAFSRRIPDTVYPKIVIPNQTVYTLPKPWTVGGTNAAGDIATVGHFVAGIISGNGTKYYAFARASWEAFLGGLFSDNYYIAVLSAFGAQEYPEAKVAVNPMQFITSVVFVPLGVGSGNYRIPSLATVDRIKVGTVTVGTTVPASFTAYEVDTSQPASPWTYTLSGVNDIPPLGVHPQAATRGDWLNFAPYTEYELFYPPCGTVKLDPDVLSNVQQLKVTVRMDFKAACGMLEVSGVKTAFPAHERILYRAEFGIGAAVMLTNVMTPGSNIASRGMYSFAQGFFSTENPWYNLATKIPIVGGFLDNGVSSYVTGQTPHMTQTGNNESLAGMGGTPQIVVNHWMLATDDNAGKGRPLCELRQISTIPGFITAESEELQIPCTTSELAEIRSAVKNGFYYE